MIGIRIQKNNLDSDFKVKKLPVPVWSGLETLQIFCANIDPSELAKASMFLYKNA